MIICLLSALHLMLLRWLFSEGDYVSHQKSTGAFQQQITVAVQYGLKNTAILSLLLIGVMVGIIFSALEVYWQPFLQQFQQGNQYDIYGWVATGYFFAAAVGQAIYATIASRLTVSSSQQISIIILLVAILLWLLANTKSTLSFTVFYLCFMAVFSCINTPIEVLMNQHTHDNIRSTMYSVLSLTILLGSSICSFLFALLLNWFDIAAAWQGLAVLLFLIGTMRIFNNFYNGYQQCRSIIENVEK